MDDLLIKGRGEKKRQISAPHSQVKPLHMNHSEHKWSSITVKNVGAVQSKCRHYDCEGKIRSTLSIQGKKKKRKPHEIIHFFSVKQKTVRFWQQEIAETQCEMPLKTWTSSFFATTH